MELRHLRYFVAVAEEQNVTRAAARLHVSQPPLSRQIRDLEDELGVQLFERRPQALRLTEAGRLFLIEARAILARADEAVRSVQAQAAGGSRELHVGYAPSLAAEFLPAALAQWRTQTPRTRVVLHDLATEEMLVALREERLQAGLLVRPPAAAQRGLNFAELKRYRVAVAMNPAHRLGRTARPTLEQVAREPLTVYARKEYPEYLDWLSGVLRPTGQAPRIAAEVDSASSLVTALEADDSVALVQEGFECFSGARLLVRPVEPPPPALVVGLAWRRSAAAEIKGLLAALQEAVGRAVPQGRLRRSAGEG